MHAEPTYAAFAGPRRIAAGPLPDILPTLKERFDRDPSELILVFESATGRQVDFNLRGPLDDVLARHVPSATRGPGRPRLGVTSREVSLLPRHWDWLESQPNGISAALRRLVEQAIKTEPGRERARHVRDALNKFMTAMAGDRPNYEESTRALYAGDTERFGALVARWPKDIREHVLEQIAHAARLERGGESP
ncbi:MAG: DUF2239 family protein [Myxococcota bacterium]